MSKWWETTWFAEWLRLARRLILIVALAGCASPAPVPPSGVTRAIPSRPERQAIAELHRITGQ